MLNKIAKLILENINLKSAAKAQESSDTINETM